MLIRVMYDDGKYDYVLDTVLNQLLDVGRIQQFCRRDGWVVVGRDPIRGMGGDSYNGPERRKLVLVR